MKHRLTDILQAYHAQTILKGKETAKKALMDDLKLGLHAEIFYDMIMEAIEAIDLIIDSGEECND